MRRLRELWGRIVDWTRVGPQQAHSEADPTPPKPELVHVADLRAVAELWPPGEEARSLEDTLLDGLQDREPALRARIDAAVKDRVGPEFEVRRLAITRGSIELLIPIFGALGAYGAARSGFDYLVSDVRRILGRDVRNQIGWTPDFDVYVVRREGLVPGVQPAAGGGGSDKVALWLIGAGAFTTTTLGLIGATGANLERVRINYPWQISLAFSVIILAILVGVCWPLLSAGARLGFRGRLALFALLAGVAGTVLLQNSDRSTVVSVAGGAAVAAIVFALGWHWARSARPGQGGALIVAVLAVGVAVGLIAYWATNSVSDQTRPRITASLTQTGVVSKVAGAVRASGLKRRQHVLVRIIGINSRANLAKKHVGHARSNEPKSTSQLVYGSRTGADADGNAEVNLDVPVATGLYDRLDVETQVVDDDEVRRAVSEARKAGPDDQQAKKQGLAVLRTAQVPIPGIPVKSRCDKPTRVVGCLSIFVPPVAGGPQLSASWAVPAGKRPRLNLRVRMGDLSSDDRVLLSVRRIKGKRGRLGGRVYGALWAPEAGGKVDETVALKVDPRRRPLCVIMRTLQGALNYASPEASHLGPCGKRSRGVAILLRPPGK
jgi:hypothetical protein